MELDTIAGPQWAGWTVGDDGLIYAPEWRRGLHPGEIRALPYLNASIADAARRLKVAQDALQAMEALCHQAERQARYYRSLVSLEARYGLMFSQVAG